MTKYICKAYTFCKGLVYRRGDTATSDEIGDRPDKDPCWERYNNITATKIKEHIPEAIAIARQTAENKQIKDIQTIIDVPNREVSVEDR